MTPPLRRTLGPYELVRELGRGAMGIVYVARHRDLGREVALKVIADQPTPEAHERFLREGRAAARLDHPGIVRVHDLGRADGVTYLALELVEGESLKARLAREGPLPPLVAALFVRDVARAVAQAHDVGIVHRDIKPDNILIDRSGRPRLTDFGIVRDLHDQGRLSTTGQILGTPWFMAPEQADSTVGEVGPWTDVHALGAMLHLLLTGVPVFNGTTLVEVVRKILEQRPDTPSSLRPRVPPELDRIVRRCLEKEGSRRYPSAGPLADDLDRLLRDAARAPARRALLLAGVVAFSVTAGLSIALALRPAPASVAPTPDGAAPVPSTPPTSTGPVPSTPPSASTTPPRPPRASPATAPGPWRGHWHQVERSANAAWPAARTDHAAAYVPGRGVVIHGGVVADGAVLGDAWSWDGHDWTRLDDGPADLALRRSRHQLAWDAGRGALALVGGVEPDALDRPFSALGTVLENDGRWRLRQTGGPGGVFGACLVVDPSREALLLVGGGRLEGDRWTISDETWALRADGWSRLAFEPRPPARLHAAAAWDSARRVLVLFGGSKVGGAGFWHDDALLADLWELDDRGWHERHVQGGPERRRGAGLVDVRGRLVLFGGIDKDRLNDTWTWDGERWEPVELRGGPPPPSWRCHFAMAYDPSRRVVVLFGGSPDRLKGEKRANDRTCDELWELRVDPS